jgi:transcriptional regulator with GAF, ATPase, and Fis domain
MNRQVLTTKPIHSNKDVETLQKKVDILRKETLKILKEVKSFSFIYSSALLSANDNLERGIDLEEEIKNIEIRLIKRALEIAGGSQIQAARLLRIKHTTLNAKIKRYGINHKEILFAE